MVIDPALTARVERAIARERSVFAEGMATIWRASRATWLPVAHGRANFTGPGYYSNRAFGVDRAATHSGDLPARIPGE